MDIGVQPNAPALYPPRKSPQYPLNKWLDDNVMMMMAMIMMMMMMMMMIIIITKNYYKNYNRGQASWPNLRKHKKIEGKKSKAIPVTGRGGP
jgi:heme/copper-type cytochrome/quinol oxidase subunit 2